MNVQEAAHKLRISVALLKWFTGHSPKSDGRKLRLASSETFDEKELDEFDAYLRGPWPDRSVCDGVSRELKIEARGQCGNCREPRDNMQEAHIDRKDIEIGYYCQHPQNMILLCLECHGRYDLKAKKTKADEQARQITNAVIKYAKAELVSWKMQGIDRDIKTAAAIAAAVGPVKDRLRSMMAPTTKEADMGILLWKGGSIELLHQITLVTGVPGDAAQPLMTLGKLLDSVPEENVFTRAMVSSYSAEASGSMTPPISAWSYLNSLEEAGLDLKSLEILPDIDAEIRQRQAREMQSRLEAEFRRALVDFLHSMAAEIIGKTTLDALSCKVESRSIDLTRVDLGQSSEWLECGLSRRDKIVTESCLRMGPPSCPHWLFLVLSAHDDESKQARQVSALVICTSAGSDAVWDGACLSMPPLFSRESVHEVRAWLEPWRERILPHMARYVALVKSER